VIEKSIFITPVPQPPELDRAWMIAAEWLSTASLATEVFQGSGATKSPPGPPAPPPLDALVDDALVEEAALEEDDALADDALEDDDDDVALDDDALDDDVPAPAPVDEEALACDELAPPWQGLPCRQWRSTSDDAPPEPPPPPPSPLLS
jgi:hypothetical protein